MSFLASLLWPAGLPLLLAAAWVHGLGVPDRPTPALEAVGWSFFAGAIVLALRFRRARALLSAAAILASAEAVQRLGPWPATGAFVHQGAAIALGLSLLLFAFVDEGRGLFRALTGPLAAVCAGGLGLALVVRLDAGFARDAASLLSLPFLGTFPLPAAAPGHAALLAFAAAFAVVLGRFAWKRAPSDLAHAGAAFAALLALSSPVSSGAAHVWWIAAAAVLAAGVLESAYRLAYRDELTGLPGRRALMETLRSLSPPFAVAMVDVDHFKRFNDTHGHDAGDQVLRMVASRLGRVGGGGEAFRYGGEEFTLVFPRLEAEEAREHVDAVRRRVAETRFGVRSSGRPRKKPSKPRNGAGARAQVQVTFSAGVASPAPRSAAASEVVLAAADKRLYEAKRAGRNRVV